MEDARKPDWPSLGIIVSAGFFALAAQTLLFRIFLTVFEGNEIGIACFFSSWLVWVFVGALFARLRTPMMNVLSDRFEFLPLLYLPAYVLQWWLISHARELAGVRPYALFPLLTMMPVAFLGNAPVSFCTGMLFTLACRWARDSDGSSVAKVYTWECVGGVFGGLVVTLLLARGVAEETLFLYAALLVTAMFAIYRLSKRSHVSAVLPVLAVVAALYSGVADHWRDSDNRHTWQRVISAQLPKGSFTTPEAKYLYGEYGDQFNVMVWETVADTIPATEHASEIVALHLAQRPAARRFLVAGRGAFSICRRLLILPQTEKITWFDPDPAYPAQLLSILPQRFLPGVERLELPKADMRGWLGQTQNKYDVIILDWPDDATLALNRYFTQEFFELLKTHMSDSGIIGVRVSAGENFMSEDRVNAGASVFATLRSVFKYLVIKPGDESWLLVSDNPGLTTSPAALRDRFAAINGANQIYPADALMALYLPQRIEFEMQSYEAAVRDTPGEMLLNTDRHPRALLHALLFAAHEAGGVQWLGGAIRMFALHGLLILPLGLLLFALLRVVFLLKSRGVETPADGKQFSAFDGHALVFTTGAAGMGGSILLMFLYQSAFGSIFLHMGLISAVFMLGLALGSAASARIASVGSGRTSPGLLCGVILMHVLLCGAIMSMATSLTRAEFVAAFLLSGLFNGAYVPLAVRRMNAAGMQDTAAGAWIEAIDHLGGAVGGLVTGLILLPVFGASYTLVVLMCLLATNLTMVWLPARNRVEIPDYSSRSIGAFGYVIFGTIAFALMAGILLHRGGTDEKRQAFLAFARSAAGKSELQTRQLTLGNGKTMDYFCVTNEQPAETGSSERYIFQTDTLSPDIVGYGGPITLAVVLDADGTIQNVTVLNSEETPSYLEFLGPWINRLLGGKLFTPDPLKDVDAVTGATLTSTAILRILRQAGPAFGRDALGLSLGAATTPAVSFSTLYKENVWLVIAIMTALALRIRPSRWLRRGFLLLVVVFFGFVFNMQYSLAHVFSLLKLSIPPFGLASIFALIAGIPLVVTLFGNVYCGYLCPFGALQELVGDLRPAFLRTDPDKTIWAYARFVKYLLLALMTLFFATTLESALASNDPLVTMFAHERSHILLWLGGLLLALAFVYPRFWCRTLCPTGAFLSLLNGIRLFKRLIPFVAPRACVYGVRESRELDCLCCDRCRRPGRQEERVLARSPDWIAARPVRTILLSTTIALAFILAVQTTATWRSTILTMGNRGQAGMSGSGAKPVDMQRLRYLIEQGKLSDKEARFYKTAPNGPSRP